MEKPISQRKIEANRRNSKSSTGPKTPRGKLISSANSLIHGIFARTAVLTGPPLFENPIEFVRLLEGVRADLEPVGALEDALVQQIVLSKWHEARHARYQAGVTQGQAQEALKENGRRLEADAWSGKRPHPANDTMTANDLKVTSSMVWAQMDLIELLSDTDVALENSDQFLQRVWMQIRDDDDDDRDEAADWRKAALDHLGGLSVEQRAALITKIEEEATALLPRLSEAYSENVAMDVALDRALVPDEAELNKILRYSAHLARQGERLLNQLMKLQARRLKRQKRVE